MYFFFVSFLQNTYTRLSNCHQFSEYTIYLYINRDVCPKCVIPKSVSFYIISCFFRCFKSINFIHIRTFHTCPAIKFISTMLLKFVNQNSVCTLTLIQYAGIFVGWHTKLEMLTLVAVIAAAVAAAGCHRCNHRRLYCHHHRHCKPDRINFARAIMTNIIIGFIRAW